MTECYIYYLSGPDGVPFYVGATKDLGRRLKAHIYEAKYFLRVGEKKWVNDKIRKIAEIILCNGVPEISVIEICSMPKAAERELFHCIEFGRKYKLLQIPPEKHRIYTYAYKFK